jgi:hypothetical protein
MWLVALLGAVPWVLLLGLILILGVAHFRRVAPGRHLWKVAWAGAVVAGIVLMALVNYVHVSPYSPYTGPTMVSWGELPVSTGFLALGAVMIAILAGAARSASRRAP